MAKSISTSEALSAANVSAESAETSSFFFYLNVQLITFQAVRDGLLSNRDIFLVSCLALKLHVSDVQKCKPFHTHGNMLFLWLFYDLF